MAHDEPLASILVSYLLGVSFALFLPFDFLHFSFRVFFWGWVFGRA